VLAAAGAAMDAAPAAAAAAAADKNVRRVAVEVTEPRASRCLVMPES